VAVSAILPLEAASIAILSD